jgi:hypothetical protein
MPIASGIAKQLRYKAETTWGTAPLATGAQLLRRVSSDLDLDKQTYESNEKVSHYQRVDVRHGVLSATATVLTVIPLNGVALVAEGPIAAATWTVPGKKVIAPLTGHTDPSFAFEHWHSDISRSELFLGCKLQDLGIQLPAQGMTGISMSFLGKDMTPAAAQYFTSPTAETETGVLAAASGALSVQGSQIALVTGMDFSISGNQSAEPVAFSDTYAEIAEGRIVVRGRLTAHFQDATLKNYFVNETEVSLAMALAVSKSAAADFIAFAMPRIKVGGGRKDDGEKSIIQTLPFEALLNVAGGTGTDTEETTIAIQDSQAT